jgi:glycosyltransferase involved in cell wall biosynthesis
MVLRTGVNIYGYVYAESGVGEHTRLLIEAVKEAGLDYAVVPFTKTLSRQEREFDDLGSGKPEFSINIVGVNADVFPEFAHHFGPETFAGRYTIGLWAWEIEDFPIWMARSSSLVDEIWANSSFSGEAIQKVVCRPVLSFPLPIATPKPPRRSRGDLGLPEGFLYLFCFDFDSIFDRKNPDGLVEAYKKAFPSPEGPTLLVKSINGERHQEQLERLQAAAGDRPDIKILNGYWEAAEQAALMGTCDAYVSLHRAEGFGLTIAEAMALGKPVVATGYSGNLDYMSDANSYLVPYELVGVGRGCEPYPTSSVWAEPDIDAAAALMRRVWEQPQEALIKTEQAKLDIDLYHSPRARAQFVRRRLEVIVDETSAARTLPRPSPALRSDFGNPHDTVRIEVPVVPAGAETGVGEGADRTGLTPLTQPIVQQLIQGPDAGMPSALGWPVRLLRKLVLRLLQNFYVYQRGIDEGLVEAIQALEKRIEELRKQRGGS